MEKPVIATGYSGNVDYMTPENSYLCGYDLTVIGPGNHHYSNLGDWANVKVDEAAYWMDYVVKNYEEAKGKAKRGKEDILRNYSLSAVGSCVEKRLKTISSEWDPAVDRFSQRNLYISCVKDYIVHSCYMLTKHYGGAVKRRVNKLKSKLEKIYRGQRD